MASEVRRTANSSEWKVKEVSELVERIGKSRVVGVVGMREIPASDLQQQMRGALEKRSRGQDGAQQHSTQGLGFLFTGD